jgi:hypothetical protein
MVGKKRVEVEGSQIVVSPDGARSVGLDPKRLEDQEGGGS